MNARRPAASLRPSILCACLALSACGGEAPAPAVPAGAGAKPVAEAPKEAPPDVTSVAEPPGLVMVGRVAKPSASIAVVSGWLRAQLPGVPQIGSDVVSELIAGDSVGAVVDLDQPIDVAAYAALKMSKGKAGFAISAAVTSLEKAKAAFSQGDMKLVPAGGGILRIDGMGPPKGEEEEDEEERRACALVPAYGAASTRLVCGFGADAINALAPYLARTATRAPSVSDVHVEVRLAAVHAFVQENRRMIPLGVTGILGSTAQSNPALQELVLAAANDAADLALDVESIAIDAKLGDASADATLTTKYKGASSLLAKLVTFRPDRVDVPPAAFFRLPADSESASFYRGVDEKDLSHPRDLVAAALAGFLAKDGVALADVKPLTDAVGKLLTGAPMVGATGVDIPTVEKALAAARDAKDAARPAAELAAREALVGWRIVGVEEPAARFTAAVKDAVAGWNRPGLAKWLKKQSKDRPPSTLKIVPLAKAAGLPADTLHVELAVSPKPESADESDTPREAAKKGAVAKKAPPAKPMRFHLYVVPEGNRTWIGFGGNEELVVARVKAVLAGAPEAGTIAKRAGIDAIRDTKANSAGFFTIGGLASSSMVMRPLDGSSSRQMAEAFAALSAGSAKGKTPMIFISTMQPLPGGAPGGTSVSTVRLPRPVIEDFVKIALRGGFKP